MSPTSDARRTGARVETGLPQAPRHHAWAGALYIDRDLHSRRSMHLQLAVAGAASCGRASLAASVAVGTAATEGTGHPAMVEHADGVEVDLEGLLGLGRLAHARRSCTARAHARSRPCAPHGSHHMQPVALDGDREQHRAHHDASVGLLCTQHGVAIAVARTTTEQISLSSRRRRRIPHPFCRHGDRPTLTNRANARGHAPCSCARMRQTL